MFVLTRLVPCAAVVFLWDVGRCSFVNMIHYSSRRAYLPGKVAIW